MAENLDPVSSEAAPLREPASFTVIPDYELLRLIGRGSYGEVWLARNLTGAYRAIKIIYERTFRHRRPFDREFNGVLKFEPISRLHDGLVDVLHVGRNDTGGYFYYVMELADDAASGQSIDPENYSPRTLAQDMAKHKKLPLDECLRLGEAIGNALGFLHAKGLTHRDVKPSNIVFVNGIPKLADIGLVAEMSEARSYVGTEGFIPPEGPGTIAADIFSLGKVLYEISTGKDRHEYPDLPTHLDAEERLPEFIELNHIIWRACRPEARERYPSAEQLAADLQALRHGKGGWLRNRVRNRVRHMAVKVASGAAVLAMAGALWFHQQLFPRPIPAPEGLVAWWKGDGNGKDAAGRNPVLQLDGVTFAPGKVGKGFRFDGTRHPVVVPNAAALNVGTNEDFSIEAWIQPEASVTSYDLMAIASVGWGPSETEFQGYELGLTGGKLRLVMSDKLARYGFSAFGGGGPNLRDGRFHHVAATVDRQSRTGGKLYVDGKRIYAFDPTSQSGLLSSTNALRIGSGANCDPDYNISFKGIIDELSIYKRALSPEEIEAVYNAGAGGKQKRQITSEIFAPNVHLSTERGPLSAAIADFDGNGKPDFAVAAAFANKVSVYRNISSKGTLGINSFELPLQLAMGTPSDRPTRAADPQGIAAVDVDNDGKSDLVASHFNGRAVAVFKNISEIGKLDFAPPIFFAVGDAPKSIAIADFDADGRRDVAVVNTAAGEGNGSISILRNMSTPGRIDPGAFAPAIDLPLGAWPADLAAGDFDNDGRPDVVATSARSGQVIVFRNVLKSGPLGADSFERIVLPAPDSPCVLVADVDGDRKLDFLIGGGPGALKIQVFRNTSGSDPSSPVSFAPPMDLPADAWVNCMALGDLDGDGALDLIFGTQKHLHSTVPHASPLGLYANLSEPGILSTNSFGARIEFESGWNVSSVAVADLDGDGAADVLACNVYDNNISLFRNQHSFVPR